MQSILFPLDYDGMPCVASALRSDYYICSRSKVIDRFSFSFIAPLGSDYC